VAGTLEDTAIADQLERRRAEVAAEWALGEEVVLVGAGEPIPIPGRGDPTYPFRAHSEYLYLTDRNRPGGVLAFDPAAGWFDFVEPITQEEMLWSGAAAEESEGLAVAGLEPWLEQRRGRPVARLGAPVGAISDPALEDRLRHALSHVRRVKDAVELDRMRRAQRATRAGFAAVQPLLEEGRTEREVQIELEAGFLRGGADALAFDTIVGGGPNSAVLHFPPGHRPFAAGELVLIDAGGECRGYASDVTRTYPVGGALTGTQQELHALVNAAKLAAIDRCTPGTEWHDVHRTAGRVIAEGLAASGLLRGDPDGLVESGAVSLFFPHGVGHMVGLGVRDAGGALPGRRQDPDAFPRLRVDLPLRAGFAMTVEPGIYFVPALLRDEERRRRHRDAVDWERADAMLGFGGIRIEENVLVTEGAPEVLTREIPLLG
jgi:Xaa-Pro aminopeptidase